MGTTPAQLHFFLFYTFIFVSIHSCDFYLPVFIFVSITAVDLVFIEGSYPRERFYANATTTQPPPTNLSLAIPTTSTAPPTATPSSPPPPRRQLYHERRRPLWRVRWHELYGTSSPASAQPPRPPAHDGRSVLAYG